MEIIPSIIKPVIENFPLKTLRGNYLILACTGKMCTFPSPSPFEKVYFYISFLSPFDNVVNISLETIGHPQVVTLKYLRMRKRQFPNAIYNLLTKFSIERGSSGFFQLPDLLWCVSDDAIYRFIFWRALTGQSFHSWFNG